MTENIFNKWKKGLEKTRKVTFGRIANFLGSSELNDDTWDELELCCFRLIWASRPQIP